MPKKYLKRSIVAPDSFFGSIRARLEAGWTPSPTSIDAYVVRHGETIRSKSRDLTMRVGLVEGYLESLETNIIGQGVGLQAQVKQQRGGKLDRRINDMIETHWKRWGKAETCHTAGLLTFNEIERLLIRSIAESGEVFIRLVNQPFGGSKIPLGLEILEADMLDLNYNDLSRTNTIRMGVEVDSWGRPVAYHFWNRHPGDNANIDVTVRAGRTRVPAEDVIHLYIHKRPGQTRGLSWFGPVLSKIYTTSEYENSVVTRQRIIASLMGFITSQEGELQGDEETEYETLYDFEPGVFKYLPPGEDVKFPDFKGSDNPDPFLKSQNRGIARGLGASYELFSGDYSNGSYSSARQAILPERDRWRTIQRFMVEKFHQRVYERWLQQAVLANVLPFRDYVTNPERYTEVVWTPRGWKWIDPTKEMQAAVLALENKLTTRTEIIEENGGDIEKVFNTLVMEHELAESLGLDLAPESTDPGTQPTDDGSSTDPDSPDSGDGANQAPDDQEETGS